MSIVCCGFVVLKRSRHGGRGLVEVMEQRGREIKTPIAKIGCEDGPVGSIVSRLVWRKITGGNLSRVGKLRRSEETRRKGVDKPLRLAVGVLLSQSAKGWAVSEVHLVKRTDYHD